MASSLTSQARGMLRSVPERLQDSIWLEMAQSWWKARRCRESCKVVEISPAKSQAEMQVVIGEHRFQCNRELLESQSAVIRRALQDQDSGESLHLKHIDASSFRVLLQAMEGQTAVSEGNMIPLFKAAEDLEVSSIREAALSVFGQCDPDRFLRKDVFVLLPRGMVLDLLGRSGLMCSEMELFRLVVAWGQHQLQSQGKEAHVENLRICLRGMLSGVRFPLMSAADLLGEVKTSGLLDEETLLQVVTSQHSQQASGFTNHPRLYLTYTEEDERQRKRKFFVEAMFISLMCWHLLRVAPYSLQLLPLLVLLTPMILLAMAVLGYSYSYAWSHGGHGNVILPFLKNFAEYQPLEIPYRALAMHILSLVLIALQRFIPCTGFWGFLFHYILLFGLGFGLSVLLSNAYRLVSTMQSNRRIVFVKLYVFSYILLCTNPCQRLIVLLYHVLQVVVTMVLPVVMKIGAAVFIVKDGIRAFKQWKRGHLCIHVLSSGFWCISGAWNLTESVLRYFDVPLEILWMPLFWTLKYLVRLATVPLSVYSLLMPMKAFKKSTEMPTYSKRTYMAMSMAGWWLGVLVEAVLYYRQLETPLIEPYWGYWRTYILVPLCYVILLSKPLVVILLIRDQWTGKAEMPAFLDYLIRFMGFSILLSLLSVVIHYFLSSIADPLLSPYDYSDGAYSLSSLLPGYRPWDGARLERGLPVAAGFHLACDIIRSILTLVYPLLKAIFSLSTLLWFATSCFTFFISIPTKLLSCFSIIIALASASKPAATTPISQPVATTSTPFSFSHLSFLLSHDMVFNIAKYCIIRMVQAFFLWLILVWKRRADTQAGPLMKNLSKRAIVALVGLMSMEVALSLYEIPSFPPLILPSYTTLSVALPWMWNLFGDVLRLAMMVLGLSSMTVSALLVSKILPAQVTSDCLSLFFPFYFLLSYFPSVSALCRQFPLQLPPVQCLHISLSMILAMGSVVVELLALFGVFPGCWMPSAFVLHHLLLRYLLCGGVALWMCLRVYRSLQVPPPTKSFSSLRFHASFSDTCSWLAALVGVVLFCHFLLPTHFLYYLSLSFLDVQHGLSLLRQLVERLLVL